MQEVAQKESTVEIINQFNEAFNRHDVPAVMALMTEDCIFDNTYPAPDGERFEGQEAVGRFWKSFFDPPQMQISNPRRCLRMEIAASFAGCIIGRIPMAVAATYVV